VRARGIVAFAEMCLSHGGVDPGHTLICWPRTQAWRQLSTWINDMHKRLGTQTDMGYRLPEIYAAAGLEPCTQLEGELVLAVGEEAVARIVAHTQLPAHDRADGSRQRGRRKYRHPRRAPPRRYRCRRSGG